MLELHVLSTHSISVNEPSLRYGNSRQETIDNPIKKSKFLLSKYCICSI